MIIARKSYRCILGVVCIIMATAAYGDGPTHSYMTYGDIAQLYPKKNDFLTTFIFQRLIQELTPDSKRELTFTLFDGLPQGVSKTYSPLSTTLQNLNVFAYKTNTPVHAEKNLFAKINRTSTVFGETALAHLVANPTSDIVELKRRQNIVRQLVNDPELFAHIEAMVKQVKKDEDNILLNYARPDQSLIDNKYFNLKSLQALNKQEIILEASSTKGWLLQQAVLFPLLIKHSHIGHNILNADSMNWFACLTMILQIAILALQRTESTSQEYALCEKMFNNVMGVKRLMENMQNVQSYIQQRTGDYFALGIPSLAKLKTKGLKKLFKTPTFADASYSWKHYDGRIKKAYYIMQEVKERFIPYLHAVGQLDAYLSIAKLYKEHQGLNARYSFVDFIDQEKPCMQAKEFWNPMISSTKIVTNSIQLDSDRMQGILVIGPNGGGKSTIAVQGITSAIWLAQTLGITPAQHLQMTPFDYISALLKIQDDVISGVSHYQAELEQTAQAYAAACKLQQGNKIWLAVDEAYEGTNAESGAYAVSEFVKKLVQDKKILFSMVTHQNQNATTLEKETNGACRNYTVDVKVVRNALGEIELKHTHRLIPGDNMDSAIGAELFNQAFKRAAEKKHDSWIF